MAAQFDQATDRLSRSGAVPDPATACTVLGWVRIDSDTNNSATLSRIWTAGLTTVATFATDSGGLAGPNYFTGGGSVISPTSMIVGGWYAFAFACAGTSAAVYVKPEIGAVTETTGTVAGQTPPGGITLGGRDTADGTENLVGTLAYVRVFSAKLTQAQVEAEWASASAVFAAWADWPLISDLNDISANLRHLSAGSTSFAFVAGPTLPGSPESAVLDGSIPMPTMDASATVTATADLSTSISMPTMDASAIVTAEADLNGSTPMPVFSGTIVEQAEATAILDASVPLPVGGTGIYLDVTAELRQQRELTRLFIESSPIVVSLIPVTRQRKPSGGVAFVPEAPRDPQIFRLIPMSHTEKPRESSSAAAAADSGVQRRYDYTLLGNWDSVMREDDYWETPDGQKLVIEALVSYNKYQRKGLVISYGRNPSHAPE